MAKNSFHSKISCFKKNSLPFSCVFQTPSAIPQTPAIALNNARSPGFKGQIFKIKT